MSKHTEGYVALVTVIISSAVALALMATVSLLAIGEAQTGLAHAKGEEKLFFVEGCMEDALEQVWKSATYSGGIVSQPEGNCSVSVSKSGTVYTLSASATSTDYNRTIQTIVNRSGTMQVQSWKEY